MNCICRGQIAECTHLSYIPRLPKSIRNVLIKNGQFNVISATSFQNLSSQNIIKLSMINNNVKTITRKSFLLLKQLKYLEISKEPIMKTKELQLALKYAKLERVLSIRFSYNKWRTFPFEIIDVFPHVRYINLKGNKIESINWTSISTEKQVLALHLENNIIESLNLDSCSRLNVSLIPLLTLGLDSNKIVKLEHLDCLPRLKELNLNNNFKFELLPSTFSYLKNLQRLSMWNNFIHKIPPHTFVDLPKLQRLTLSSDGKSFITLQPHVFDIPSLEELYIRRAIFRFDETTTDIFKKLINLKILDMSYNTIGRTNLSSTLKTILLPLRSIRTLLLDSLNLVYIPEGLFSNFPFLERISLRNNKINIFTNGYLHFGNLSTLRNLDMSVNRLNYIYEKSFTRKVFFSLKQVDFSRNVFTCRCDLSWFIKWMESSKIKFQSSSRYYQCWEPASMKYKSIIEYRPTKQECFPLNPIYTTVVSVLFSGFLMVIFLSIALRCQPTIKNYIYLMRLYYRRRSTIPFEDSNSFDYDAFVIYCSADSQWVHTILLTKIEGEGFRLCVHQRDFEPGEAITGNVDNFLKKSWKVIVVMSNEFSKSEWCQWEVDVVQERRRRLGRDVIVLITLENVSSRNMTGQMRTLLDSTPYLCFRSGQGEDVFWKCVIVSLRKPLGRPPISEL